MTGPFDTIAEAEKCAVRESEGGLYATLCACFGVFVTTSKTLHIHAPADACTPFYYHKGVRKPFTDAQKIADQNSTPTMY